MSGNFKNILFGEGNRLRGMKRYIAAAVTLVMGGGLGFFAVTGNADSDLSDVAYEDDTIVIETLPSFEETDDNAGVFSAKVATYTREAVTVGVDGNIRRCDMVTEDETEETSVSENEAVSEGSANVSEYSLAAPEDDDEDGASSALDYEVETEVKETISVVAVEPEMSKEAEETEAAVEAEIEALNNKIAASKLDGVLNSAKQIKSVKLIAFNAEGMDVDSARTLGDKIKAEHPDTVAVLAVNAHGKLNFIAVAGKDAVANGIHSGKLVGAVAAVTGGKGGGRPDSAMAGGVDTAKIDEALKKSEEIVETMSK